MKFLKIVPLIIMVILAGCKGKGGCTDPNAENFDPSAEVEDNTCISPRDKFKGIYTIMYQCSANKQPEVKLIEVKAANDNLTDILIYGLNGYTIPTRATVNKSEFKIFKSRNIIQHEWQAIVGSGNIVGGSITIQYSIEHPYNASPVYYSCVATLNK